MFSLRCLPGVAACVLLAAASARAGQSPDAAAKPDVPISHRDRVYAAEQFSNTVSVTDPADNKLLGVIRLGDPEPGNLSPLYRGQVLVHGMGFSPDHRTLVVVSVASNSVTFIDTATNAVEHVTYVGRSPHEAFFTPDGKSVWVTIRGQNYISVLDAHSHREVHRITVPNGPGMQIFSPDGTYGYVCSSFVPKTIVVRVADRKIVGSVPQASPFCPNIAATPDGSQVWFTLKDSGKVQVFDAHPPFRLLETMTTGPITNHVNFSHTAAGTFAYVTVGGLNVVKVFRTIDFTKVATIAVGALPHGIWPSGDGGRMYVGLENDDRLLAIDTATNTVVASVPIGQAPQAVVYVPNAVPTGGGTSGLVPLGASAHADHFALRPAASSVSATSVTLFDQGFTQILEACVTGLHAGMRYVLALSAKPDGSASIQPLADFKTNAAGAAIVNAVGPIRQVLKPDGDVPGRFMVILAGTSWHPGPVVQIESGHR